MNKFRQPPIVTIEGTSFLVDINRQVLRQTNDAENEISFIDHMQDLGTYYLLRYNADKKQPAFDGEDTKVVKLVIIPPLAQLDPQGMSEKYGLPVDELNNKTDFEIIVDQRALLLRHQGILPQIDLAGELFIVDLRLNELRHAQNFHPVISLKSFDFNQSGQYFEGYYHTALKQVVSVDPGLTELPPNLVKLRLPNALGLDPVGVASATGLDERRLLRRFPVVARLKAQVIPISETGLPALVQRNRQQLQDEHACNRTKIRLNRRSGL